jgi:hypothetical protein
VIYSIFGIHEQFAAGERFVYFAVSLPFRNKNSSSAVMHPGVLTYVQFILTFVI